VSYLKTTVVYMNIYTCYFVTETVIKNNRVLQEKFVAVTVLIWNTCHMRMVEERWKENLRDLFASSARM
jgi:hypothetical protein